MAKNKITESQLDFMKMARSSAEERGPEEEEPGFLRSVASAIPRGLAKGTQALGRVMGPLPEEYPGEFDPSRLEEVLNNYLPVGEGAVPEAVERAGELFPLVAASPGGGVVENILRTVGAASSGQVAKEAGAPEWAQSLAELPAFLAPNLSASNTARGMEATGSLKDKFLGAIGKMTESGEEPQKILDFGRKMGLSEEQITPLIQSEMKKNLLSQIASKGQATQEALSSTRSGIGDVYQSLRSSEVAQQVLSETQQSSVVKSIQDRLANMPSSVRSAISDDFQQLLSSDITGNSLMKFFSDVNHELGPKTKQLAPLKDPIKKAISEIDPVLAEGFDMTNRLYGKYADIAKKLKPGMVDKAITGSEALGTLYAVINGDIGALAGVATGAAGITAVRKLGAKMLTSPRLQNLSGKMVSSLNQGKWVVAEKLKNQMIDEIKDVDPNVARMLQMLNIKDELGS